MMIETEQVAGKLGIEFPISLDKRIDGAIAVGAHKTSMLQDFEQGRSLEIDSLVTAVIELGRLVDVPTPTLDEMLALVLLKVRVLTSNPMNKSDQGNMHG